MAIGALLTVLVPLLAAGGGLYQFKLAPLMDMVGEGRIVASTPARCHDIAGTPACEDMWLDRSSGLSYLACMPHEWRQPWVPATLKLNATALPQLPSTGFFATFDTNTEKLTKLRVSGYPRSDEGLFLHGFDLFVQADGKTATLFAINHRLPAPELRPRAHEIGADSVIEVFTTTLGSDELRWVRTLEHPLINTPNNLVAISETQLFLTNDHKYKIHILRRKAEAIWDLPSSIVYCDLGAGAATSPDCKISATTIYPNGITRGPDNTLWQASSTGGEANHWEWDAEYNLHKLDSVKLNRIMDNINVDENGAVYFPTFGDLTKFHHHTADPHHASPTVIYKISNTTSSEKYFGEKYELEAIFSDDGSRISGTTNVISHKNKLYLTGVNSKALSVCELSA